MSCSPDKLKSLRDSSPECDCDRSTPGTDCDPTKRRTPEGETHDAEMQPVTSEEANLKPSQRDAPEPSETGDYDSCGDVFGSGEHRGGVADDVEPLSDDHRATDEPAPRALSTADQPVVESHEVAQRTAGITDAVEEFAAETAETEASEASSDAPTPLSVREGPAEAVVMNALDDPHDVQGENGARESNGSRHHDTIRSLNALLNRDDISTNETCRRDVLEAIVGEVHRGNLACARAALTNSLILWPNDPVLHFNLACVESRSGDLEQSLMQLALAVEHGYENVLQIDGDPDLEAVRGQPDFAQLRAKLDHIETPRQRQKRRLSEAVELQRFMPQLSQAEASCQIYRFGSLDAALAALCDGAATAV